MDNQIRRLQRRMLSTVRGSKKWRRIVSTLSCVVVFCTTYALILPAITATKPTYCGLEEHTHSDECMGQSLICPLTEELDHVHSDSCYGSTRVLVCMKDETEGHTHDDSCRETTTEQTCTDDSEGHVHGDGCFTEKTEIVCGKDETEAHVHGDDCYIVENGTICKPHVHSENCYTTELACELTEHQHTDACYEVDAEEEEAEDEDEAKDEAKWLQKLPTPTGHWSKDLLAAALSQVNYAESEADVQNGNGYTIYGAAYGAPYADWDAAFASWLLKHNGVPSVPTETKPVYVPQKGSTALWTAALREAGLFHEGKTDWAPKAGELMFFTTEGTNRVAVVIEPIYKQETGELMQVHAVMGDCENMVLDEVFTLSMIEVQGWVELPQNPDHPELYPADTQTEVEPDEETTEEETTDGEGEDSGELILGSADGLGENMSEYNFDCIAYTEEDPAAAPRAGAAFMALAAEPRATGPIDVRPFILNRADGVVVKWHPAHEDPITGEIPWYDIPTGPDAELPADAHLRVEVKYAKVVPEDLAAAGYKLIFTPDELLTDLMAEGSILVEKQPLGTISVVEDAQGRRSVQLEFDHDWVDSLVENNVTITDERNKLSVSGDFYFQAELDLSNLDNETDKSLNLGPVRIPLPVGNNAAARYAEANIDKSDPVLATNADGSYFKDASGNFYLEYSVTVNTGRYGIPDVIVTDTLGGKTATVNGQTVTFIGSHPYLGLQDVNGQPVVTTPRTVSTVPVQVVNMPVETFTSSTGTYAAGGHVGQVYYTNQPTYSQPGYAALDANGQSLVWNIGNMGPHEERTLTYRVAVSPDYVGVYHDGNVSITNNAALSAMGFPHGNDATRLAANGNASVSKNYSAVDGPDANGKYTVHYEVTVTAPEGNTYPMTNLKLYDKLESKKVDSMTLLDEHGNPVIENGKQVTYWDLVSYNFTNGNTDDILIDGMSIAAFNNAHSGETPAHIDVHNEPDGQRNPYFDLYIGDLNPGQTRTITYTMTLDDRVAVMGNNLGIDNTVELHDDDTKNGGNKMLNDSFVSVNASGQRWDRKLGGNKLTLATTISTAGGSAFEPSGSGYAPAANPGSFVAPAGAYSYTVIVNEKGEWDVAGSALQDTLGIPNGQTTSPLVFTGYMQVSVYDKLTDETTLTDDQILALANRATPNKTIWVKIDGQKSFNLKARDLGIDTAEDGKTYVMRYYAKVDDAAKVSNVIVGNDFTMTGTVGNGSGYIYLNGIRSSKSVTATGVYKFDIRKEFWYYDENDKTFSYLNEKGTRVYPGAHYWAIKIDATKLAEGTVFQESVNSYNSFNSLIHQPKSLMGFYIGNIEENPGADKTQAYMQDKFDSFADMLASNRLREVTFDYDVDWSSGGDLDGWEVNVGAYGEAVLNNTREKSWDVSITVNEDVGIPANESVYMIVRTEPYLLPVSNGTGIVEKQYQNKVNYYDPLNKPGGSWPNRFATTYLADGTRGLDKTPGGVYKVMGSNGLTWEQYRGNYVNGAYTSQAKFQQYDFGSESRASGFVDMNGVKWGNGNNDGRSAEPIRLSTLVVASDKAAMQQVYSNSTYRHNNDQVLNYQYPDGVYVTWNVTVNKSQLLKPGDPYTIIDELPSGVELAYVRTYSGADSYTAAFTGADFSGLNSMKYRVTGESGDYADWTSHAVGAPLNGNYWNDTYTNYYTKDNKVAIYIPKIARGSVPVFQVVARVTDPNASFEDVSFTNVAKLYDTRNTEIDAHSATIWAANGSLSKEDLASSGDKLTSNVLPYEIILNETAQNMQPDADKVGVPLVDHMSSNLSVEMNTLRIYAGSVSPDNLIYDGRNENNPIVVDGSRLYYAVNRLGEQLYWDYDRSVGLQNFTSEPGDYRIISTKADAYGTGTPITGADGYYFVGATGDEEFVAGYSASPTPFTNGVGIPEGVYIIKNPNGGDMYVTDQNSGVLLAGTANRANATPFTISKVDVTDDGGNVVGSAYTITSNGMYMNIPANGQAKMQPGEQLMLIEEFTANPGMFGGNGVTIRNKDYSGAVQYLNKQGGGSYFGGYTNQTGNNTGMLMYAQIVEKMTPGTPFYWNSAATMTTTPTPFPVITTNAGADVGQGNRLELMTKDANTGVIVGNVPNAFRKLNDFGQPLYTRPDGTETTESTTDGVANTPTMTTTSIRVAVEPYVAPNGETDGSKVIKFYDLPDSVKLIIKYDVSASLIKEGNSYSNSAYWDEHGTSGDAVTKNDNMQLDVGATAESVAHGAVKIIKYNGADTSEKLKGAEFSLFVAKYVTTDGDEYIYHADGTLEKIPTTVHPSIYSVTKDASGNKTYEPMNPVRDDALNLIGFEIDDQYVPLNSSQLTSLTLEHKLILENGHPVLGDKLASRTTGSNGVVTYGLTDDDNEDSIHFNKVYGIKETKAPNGYDLDDRTYFFVVPSQLHSGSGHDYFFHNDESDFPDSVHIVRRAEGKTPTYFLDVYDYKGSAQVMKEFGGNGAPENNYKPGTYRFGIWESANVDDRGVPTGAPMDTGVLTYAASDFGWYIPTDSGWTEFAQTGGQWQSRPVTSGEDGSAIHGQWQSVNSLPSGAVYGILPNCRKVLTFKDLTFDADYYVYELDDFGEPILTHSVASGNDFYVNYGAPAGQPPVYIPGTQKLAVDGSRVTPFKDENDVVTVPVVVATNNSYQITVSKNFSSKGELLERGVVGEFRFGLFKVPSYGEPDLTRPMQIRTITWSKGDPEASKQVRFDDLDPGRYVVYELTESNVVLTEGQRFYAGGNAFTVGYNENNSAEIVTGNSAEAIVNITNDVQNVSLPHTGGIGTTLFYVIGGILVAGAGILLITKKRMDDFK